MILSKTTGYGIRALGFIANHGSATPCSLQEIADGEGIPPIYLQKVLGQLRRHRLLRSVRGIGGGYEFDQAPESISLWEVFRVLEPDPYLEGCIIGRNTACHEASEGHCALHDPWVRMREELIDALKKTTIAQVAQTMLAPPPPGGLSPNQSSTTNGRPS